MEVLQTSTPGCGESLPFLLSDGSSLSVKEREGFGLNWVGVRTAECS